MTIELLYFGGCPSWQHAWARLGEALSETGVDAPVRLRRIETLPERERAGFAGSPTVRIDGRDLEGYDGPAVMACRVYDANEGRGWPSRARLKAALASAVSERA